MFVNLSSLTPFTLLKARIFLAIVFPGYCEAFSNITGNTFIAILKIYKTPKRILETPRNELIDFIKRYYKKGLEGATKTYDKLINATKIAITFSHQLSSSYVSN